MLVYLVLTVKPSVFSSDCGTTFLPPTNTGIHLVMPNPAPTAAVLSRVVRYHKHEVHSFNKYHAVDQACKNSVSQLISEKHYNYLLIIIIGLSKFTCLQILTHLITKYAELEYDDIQETDQRMKEPISGATIFEEFIDQIEFNQEAVAVKNPYTPAQIVSMAFSNIEKCGLYQDDFPKWSHKPRLNKTWS